MKRLFPILIVGLLFWGCQVPQVQQGGEVVKDETPSDAVPISAVDEITKQDENGETLGEKVIRHNQEIINLAKFSQSHDADIKNMAISTARLSFILSEVAKDERFVEVFEKAEMAWQERVNTINQQAQLIQQQNARLAQQDQKIAQLMESVEKLTNELGEKAAGENKPTEEPKDVEK